LVPHKISHPGLYTIDERHAFLLSSGRRIIMKGKSKLILGENIFKEVVGLKLIYLKFPSQILLETVPPVYTNSKTIVLSYPIYS
jgi:hypothetical protein